jgi:hypothetical protein
MPGFFSLLDSGIGFGSVDVQSRTFMEFPNVPESSITLFSFSLLFLLFPVSFPA